MTLGSQRVERLTHVAQGKVFGSLQLQLGAVIHLQNHLQNGDKNLLYYIEIAYTACIYVLYVEVQ